jgi:hypothetical protein
LTTAWWEGHPDLLPPDPELEPLHDRQYTVRAWKVSDDTMLLRGAVMDNKPGLMFAERMVAAGGSEDARPLTMHHMVVDLEVSFPRLEITDARVVFESFPQPGCPSITDHYRQLIGLSIARGFTHEVRQRFGGPRGCTHTTALLQAMGPVAVQCVFSMRRRGVQPSDVQAAAGPDRADAPSQGGDQASFMRDTCHVWSGDGDLWQAITMGRRPPMALPLQRRLREAGVDPEGLEL